MALRAFHRIWDILLNQKKEGNSWHVKRTVGEWILNHGYCVYLEGVGTDLHPEQGPVWDWRQKTLRPMY